MAIALQEPPVVTQIPTRRELRTRLENRLTFSVGQPMYSSGSTLMAMVRGLTMKFPAIVTPLERAQTSAAQYQRGCFAAASWSRMRLFLIEISE